MEKKVPLSLKSLKLGPDLVYVHGPRYASLLKSPKGDQVILLIGEWHDPYEEKCPKESISIGEYLTRVVKESKVQFDFLLELFYYELNIEELKEEPLSSRAIEELRSIFGLCFYPKLRAKCPFRNVRARLADVRKRETFRWIGNTIGEVVNDLASWMISEDVEMGKEIQEKYEKLTGYLGALADPKELLFYIEEETFVPIEKEIKRIHPRFAALRDRIEKDYQANLTHLKTKTTRYFAKYAELFHRSIQGFIEKRNRAGPAEASRRERDRAKLQKIYDVLIKAYMEGLTPIDNLMDYHTLARFFHDFEGDYPKNVIFYGGEFHTQMYETFLLDQGYKEIPLGLPVGKQCVLLPLTIKDFISEKQEPPKAGKEP
jgi:phosphate uptake regulator